MSLIPQDIPSKMRESLSVLTNPGGTDEQTLAAAMDKLENYERALGMTPQAPAAIGERVGAVVAAAEQIVLQALPRPLSQEQSALLSSEDLTTRCNDLGSVLERIKKLTEILGDQNIAAHGTGSVTPQTTGVLAPLLTNVEELAVYSQLVKDYLTKLEQLNHGRSAPSRREWFVPEGDSYQKLVDFGTALYAITRPLEGQLSKSGLTPEDLSKGSHNDYVCEWLRMFCRGFWGDPPDWSGIPPSPLSADMASVIGESFTLFYRGNTGPTWYNKVHDERVAMVASACRRLYLNAAATHITDTSACEREIARNIYKKLICQVYDRSLQGLDDDVAKLFNLTDPSGGTKPYDIVLKASEPSELDIRVIAPPDAGVSDVAGENRSVSARKITCATHTLTLSFVQGGLPSLKLEFTDGQQSLFTVTKTLFSGPLKELITDTISPPGSISTSNRMSVDQVGLMLELIVSSVRRLQQQTPSSEG